MNGFDPSQMDPKVMMEMSALIRELPPERLSKLQSIMHNMQAGFDVRKEMEDFEQSLPAHFRQKLFALMSGSSAPVPAAAAPITEKESTDTKMDLHLARITVLRAVSRGEMTPEAAEEILFPKSSS